MADSRVCGTSEQARGLERILNQCMTKIDAGISQMEKSVNTIHGAWNDDGAGEVDEILAKLRSALNDAKDAMPNISRKLEEYAEFLDQR